MNIYTCDIVIVGGGIAGLWALNKIHQQGLSAVLIESDQLGSKQTINSQGIIHGGLKYALSGKLNPAENAVSKMPAVWQSCLSGTGELDLSSTEVLSERQYLWSTGKLLDNLSGFFASRIIKSRIKKLKPNQYPQIFSNTHFNGQVYALKEIVLNIPSLLSCLAKPLNQYCIKIDNQDSLNLDLDSLNNNINFINIIINKINYKIKAQYYIFTAGEGNADLIKYLPQSPAMQRRPLHMVSVKSPHLPKLYGHRIGPSNIPRITITTHMANNGQPIWYLGGKLAEDGININTNQQITKTKLELKKLFPWIDFTTAKFKSFLLQRAEEYSKHGKKPDSVSIFPQKNAIVAWPSKLALAPVLAENINKILIQNNITSKLKFAPELYNFPQPNIAQPMWSC